MLSHTSFVSLLQVLQRFLKVGGVPRDIFNDYQAWKWNLYIALNRKVLLQVTRGVYAAETFSAATHELTLITVPAWRTGQTPHVCSEPLVQIVGAYSGRQPSLRCAGGFKKEQLEFRSLYIARKIWDWVQSPYRQDLCVKLIDCVTVSQWLVAQHVRKRY